MTHEARYEEELISAFVHKYPVAGRTIHALVHEFGGVQSLIGELEKRGFDEQMNLWMFAKKPKAITPEQINELFEGEQLQQLANGLGIERAAVVSQLSQYLPKLFHQLGEGDEILSYSQHSPSVSASR